MIADKSKKRDEQGEEWKRDFPAKKIHKFYFIFHCRDKSPTTGIYKTRLNPGACQINNIIILKQLQQKILTKIKFITDPSNNLHGLFWV